MTDFAHHRETDTAQRRHPCVDDPHRRGLAFVVALAVILVVASVLMVLVRHVQTEGRASVNHNAQAEARWIADGVVRALLVELVREPRLAEPDRDFTAIEPDAGVLGDGIYWLLLPDPTDAERYDFGITAEAGKINLNTAEADVFEALHPDVTAHVAEAILAWRGDGGDGGAGAGASSHYLAQRRPYRAKEGPFETVGELLLVRDIDRELLYGPRRAQRERFDLELAVRAAAPRRRIGEQHPRGLAPLVTVFSAEPNRSFDTGQPRLNVNSASLSDLAELPEELFADEARVQELVAAVGSQRPYANVLEFLVRAELDDDEAALLYDRVSTTSDGTLRGRVDVTTAPAVVLEALPGLDASDADAIVAARQRVADPTVSPRWLIEAIGAERASEIGALITTRSLQFSADVLAVSGDGRAFVRRRVVLDVAPVLEGDAPRVLHSENLTHLGWPLSPMILQALRDGEPAAEVARRYRGRDGGL